VRTPTLEMNYAGRLDRGFQAQPSLLILLNPGRVTRHCLLDMADAARALDLSVHTYELGTLWEFIRSGKSPNPAAFATWLKERNVGAVLGYTCNGLLEFPCFRDPTGRPISIYEYLGIPHLMWWTDHPQWASERIALRPDLQPLLASSNQYHFLKSEAAACEVRELLSWRNCIGLPVAENPDRYSPKPNPHPDFDIVCITGAPPALDAELESMVESADPNLDALLKVVERNSSESLAALLRDRGPRSAASVLVRFAHDWCAARRSAPLSTSYEILLGLKDEHPVATQWMKANYQTYFDALHILWEFGRWQRTFYIRYLSRFFKTGVFGSDWSSVGLGPGGWVDYDDQASVYARGRIALNIPQAGDEQGVAHKPFQIAAARVPMAHLYRRGLEDCFVPGEEVLTFESPREARDRIAALLSDPPRRDAMVAAAYERVQRDHTWKARLPQMLSVLGDRFPNPKSSTAQLPETHHLKMTNVRAG